MAETKYQIGERIGAGGMAEVFRAALEGTRGFARPVAVKRVLPARAANPHDAAMFANEARTMATLRHPNVIAASDLARDEEGRLMLVMELSEGVDLRALVHRDLTPGNVLLSWEGAVKLADFGLARAYAGTHSRDSDAYGTPGYMSPEQMCGGPMDRRSDLFAAGVVLYELLTGTRPFVGVTRNQLEFALMRQRIDPPRERQPDLPADLDTLTM